MKSAQGGWWGGSQTNKQPLLKIKSLMHPERIYTIVHLKAHSVEELLPVVASLSGDKLYYSRTNTLARLRGKPKIITHLELGLTKDLISVWFLGWQTRKILSLLAKVFRGFNHPCYLPLTFLPTVTCSCYLPMSCCNRK